MDEYQTREDIREFYAAKRRAEDDKLYGAFGSLALLVVGGVVLYLLVRNPFKP